LLTDGSPSCGSSYIYDGTFSGAKRRSEAGVTAALLQQNGVEVFSQFQFEEADARLSQLQEASKANSFAHDFDGWCSEP
jgi:hypothetical protein